MCHDHFDAPEAGADSCETRCLFGFVSGWILSWFKVEVVVMDPCPLRLGTHLIV
jgi:hypothetical protein